MSDIGTGRRRTGWIPLVVVPIVVVVLSSPVWGGPVCRAAGICDKGSAPAAPSNGVSPSAGTGSFYAGTLHDAGEVLGVAFSPDGKLIATAGGNSHTVVLWSAATGERVRVLTGSAVVNAVAFSPDRTLIATGSDLFDPATGEQARNFGGGAYDVAFSPDSSLIATANGYMPNGVRLFSASTGGLAREVTTTYASALAFSPDGKQLAAATGYLDQGVVVWDTAAGTKIRTLAGGSTSVAYNSDGTFVATGGGKVALWNPTTGAHIRDLDATDVLAFSPDGRLLAATGPDRMVRIYDPATGNPTRTLTGVYAARLAFSPDGARIAVVTPDHIAQIVALR
jgi:WD40 repeat protein